MANQEHYLFPHPETSDKQGLLAMGGDLSPGRILQAYAQGIFPWYEPGCPPGQGGSIQARAGQDAKPFIQFVRYQEKGLLELLSKYVYLWRILNLLKNIL